MGPQILIQSHRNKYNSNLIFSTIWLRTCCNSVLKGFSQRNHLQDLYYVSLIFIILVFFCRTACWFREASYKEVCIKMKQWRPLNINLHSNRLLNNMHSEIKLRTTQPHAHLHYYIVKFWETQKPYNLQLLSVNLEIMIIISRSLIMKTLSKIASASWSNY